jgi:glutamate-1-semialdehyde 2,1-aminomutase
MSEKEIIRSHTKEIYGEYEKRTRKSQELYERARRFLPGGNTRTTIFWNPHPIYFSRGKGFNIYDLDGNTYLDFLGNYTSLIHGHAHPKILEAIRNSIEHGTAAHLPTENEVRLAELMCNRFRSVKRIRFSNSGTEATMNALRVARAYTGKDKIMKAEGAYHGTHLWAEVSHHPDINNVGPDDNPNSVPESGTPTSIAKDVIIYPFNNQEITERILRKHKEDLAAVIVEPVMRTMPPRDGFLDFLREITSENNILLVFDEVICARVSSGGAQERYGVAPDLTAFGKVFGGGLPFGAFGGREDVMEFSNPTRESSIDHGGTFNANPVTMAAGIVATEMLTSEAIHRINSLGDVQRKGMERTLEELNITAQLTGIGSYLQMHFTHEDVKDFRSSARAKNSLNAPLYISLLNNGISAAPRIMTALSTPMSAGEIDTFTDAFRKSMERIRPLIKQIAPNLIVG